MSKRFEGTRDYVATDDLKIAVNAAIALERPLLIKGEPGTGKTVLAYEIAKALDAPVLADPDVVHHPPGFDLAQSVQALEHRQDLHLAYGLVGVGSGEELRQGDGTEFELLFDLGPLTADLGCLGQGGLALFGRECGRLRHGRDDSASGRSGHASWRAMVS